MPPAIGIVADDLTGAADTGVAFLTSGLSTLVTWPAFLDDRRVAMAEVLAIDTKSRAMASEQAVAVTTRVVSRLREGGATTLYKKIDSLLRGHIGDEISAAWAAWLPGTLSIVAPAFPATGRTTRNGCQYSDGALVDAAAIPAILDRAAMSSQVVPVEAIRAGRLPGALRDGLQRGVVAVVCDAETDDDLKTIARAGVSLGSVVWVGSGGLARAVSSVLVSEGGRLERPVPIVRGPLLMAVGSQSAIARAQVAELVAAGAAHVSVPARALERQAEVDRQTFVRRMEALLFRGDDVVVTIDGAAAHRDDPRLSIQLAEWLRPVTAAVGGLILTGGDTAVSILEMWGAAAIELVAEIEPGVVVSTMMAPRPVPVVTKSGSFGDRDALVRARQWLRGNRSTHGPR